MPTIFSDGSFRKRGNVFEYRFRHEKQYVSVFGKTMAECWQKRVDIIAGKIIAKPKSAITVAKWFLYWAETFKKQKVTDDYYKSLERNIKNHIVPKIGNIPLVKLTTEDLQKFFNGISMNNTRLRLSSIIYESLEKAVVTHKIKFNPHAGTEIKREKYEHYAPLKPKLQDDLYKLITEPQYKKLYEFVCCTGMRISEALGFPVIAIDKKTNTLEVCQQLDRHNKITPILKTEAAYRCINYLPELLKGFDLKNQLLFQGISYTMARKYFMKLYEDNGIRDQVKKGLFHCWRSTFISNCSHVRIKPKQIQAWAGHEVVETTLNVYTKLLAGSSKFIRYAQRLKEKVEKETE